MTNAADNRPGKVWIDRYDWLVGGAMYFVLAYAMIYLTSNGREIAAVWAANAALIGLLASREKPNWIAVLVSVLIANTIANLLTRDSFAAPLLYGTANMMEVLAATWLLRFAIGENSVLSSLGTFFKFILIGFAAPILSGLFGALTAWWLFDEPFVGSLISWIVSDTLGILVFTPFFLALFKGEYAECLRQQSPVQRLEAAGLLALTVVTAATLFFFARQVPIFVLFIPTMLVTIRLGQHGTKAAVMLIAIVGLAAPLVDVGPFSWAPHNRDQALILQTFLFVLLFSSLPVAADLSRRGAVTAALGQREKELSHLARTDSLTGLMNRPAFIEHADRVLAQCHGQETCLIAIDVDRFKHINDTWGHHAGDQALRHLASIAGSHLRSMDALCRFGGDEFMLLLPRTAVADAERICTRLRETLRRSPLTLDDGSALLISVSCGIAAADGITAFTDLAKQADFALYEAKRAGRGTHRLAVFQSDLQLLAATR